MRDAKTPRNAAEISDPGLQQIADLEAAIILAHEQKIELLGASAEEVAHQRPHVVRLAREVGDRLRKEYSMRGAAS